MTVKSLKVNTSLFLRSKQEKKVAAEKMLAVSYCNGVGFQTVKLIMNMIGHSMRHFIEAQWEQKVVDYAKDLVLKA